MSDAPGFFDHLLTPASFDAIDELRRLASEDGWTTAGAALRFILDTPGVDSLIIAPRLAEQFAGYGIAGL